jgi:KDO2-lipid IV(A) lauroyltransferase
MSEMTVRQWIAAGVELSILRLASILPLRMLAPISKVVGAVYWSVSAESRQIILDNLSLCFPELSERARIDMGRASLAQAVLGYLEKGRWWFGDASTQPCVVDGLEHLQELASKGRGVLLLGFHFSDMETAVQLLNERVPLCAMYMRRPNPIVDAASRRSRGRRQLTMIERSDVRGVLSALRDGAVLWFAPDQEYRDRNQVPAPFFGMVLSTLSSATRLVKLSGAAVVAFTHHRERDGCRISLSPPLDGFGEDPAADATRVNRILEEAIRRNPSAYFWINRRLRSHSVAAQA